MAPALAEPSCAHCGKTGAPAICSGCRSVRYCGADCQRAAWKSGHRQSCASVAAQKPPTALSADDSRRTSTAQAGTWPVRCPSEILHGQLPRLDSITSARAQQFLCEGQALVAPAHGLLGRELLKWDWQYLSKHLPAGEKYGVMLDEGSRKIVMSHSARNGERQIDRESGADPGEDQPLPFSDQTRMSFQEFEKDARRYRQSGEGKMPYFGLHVLWRLKETDNGFLGKIDQQMTDDVFAVNFKIMKEWQETNQLPLVQRFYVFAGLGGTLYHCHYDLQPNLHVQLSGRKRFIIFPPEDWRHLYPFPVHHDLDRRSQVDLDKPDDSKFPEWKGARGMIVELEPGDALYIPPYWWHHVQSLTPETTSMAIWFFEKFPQSSAAMYGVGRAAEEAILMRDVEEFIGKHFPDEPGEEDASRPRPVKAGQVANFMQWLMLRLDLPAGSVDDELLKQLTRAPEVLEASIYQLLKESDGIDTDVQVRTKLQAFLQGRF